MAALIAISTIASAQEISLDPITIVATKTPEKTSEALAAVSAIREEQINQLMATKAADLVWGISNVSYQNRGDDPGLALNIRGLQDFGRVAVVVDGARQNFQRTGHNADGLVYIDQELIGGVDIVRGPVANIYGSGAIGGVAAFRTKDVDDVLKPGERSGSLWNFGGGTGAYGYGVGSVFAAARLGPNAEIIAGGSFKKQDSYDDGRGRHFENTENQTGSGLAKFTYRPAEGHEVKFSGQLSEFNFRSGQANGGVTTTYDTTVLNEIAGARWRYGWPEDRIFNFDANVYWTRTETDQRKVTGLAPPVGVGNLGDTNFFAIETIGFDANNTSRFDTGGWRNAFTWGVDGFRDKVITGGPSQNFTPDGERTVAGSFVQMKSSYSTWLEVIGALRFDYYGLDASTTNGPVSTDGHRVSPKITVGFTQFRGFTPYVTYAEGYRAPATTETLISGVHPVGVAPFSFLPNPNLKPEVGKNKEAGINFAYDNVYRTGDSYRAKFNMFRNNIKDFIELTPVADGATGSGGFVCPVSGFGCQEYQNIREARIDGIEFESMYDAGLWFGGISGAHLRGKNIAADTPLLKIQPDNISGTFGLRSADRKFSMALRVQVFAPKKNQDIPYEDPPGPTPPRPVYLPTGGYELVHLYFGYQPTTDSLLSFSIENLLDEQYARYTDVYPGPSTAAGPQAFNSPGRTFKFAYRTRFAN